MCEIDFILLWVDGNDLVWEQERKHHNVKEDNINVVEFRDWDNLQYIFRSFEEFSPWVRKIHFVTWGHLPEWLNISHPKLNIVKHTDILTSENLPVFNSNAIEPSIYKIKDLAEHFVLFNDDLFLTSSTLKNRFFQNGLPCDMLISNALSSSAGVGHFVLNNLEILNRHFSKKSSMNQHSSKWFNLVYGKDLLRNVALLPWPRFTGFVDPHMPQPFLKSTFEEVWENEKNILEETSASKFRNCNDVNQYLFRYWQLVKGDFMPISMKDTKYVTLKMDTLRSGEVASIITNPKYAMVCLNDSESIETDDEFEESKRILKDALEMILPEKSSFEL